MYTGADATLCPRRWAPGVLQLNVTEDAFYDVRDWRTSEAKGHAAYSRRREKNDLGCAIRKHPRKSRSDRPLSPLELSASMALAVPHGEDLFWLEKESFMETRYFSPHCSGANKTMYTLWP